MNVIHIYFMLQVIDFITYEQKTNTNIIGSFFLNNLNYTSATIFL